jgi:hypothetical protein
VVGQRIFLDLGLGLTIACCNPDDPAASLVDK